MGGTCSTEGEMRNTTNVSRKIWRKNPLGKPKCRWKHDIKVNLTNRVWGGGGLDSSGSIQYGGELLWTR